MKNLFNFIFKQIHWLLFFFLTFVSSYLLVNNSEFQRSKYLSVFLEVAGKVHSVSGKVQSYLNLRLINADLMQRIGALEEEIQWYKNELEKFTGNIQPDLIEIGIDPTIYRYTHARVTQNQSFGTNNYIILNKGRNHGIEEDMAVVSVKGIVGVVSIVSPNYSRVMPILNPGSPPVCMIKNTRFFGPLFWDGKDSRYISLRDLPSHASYAIGDTVVTSGHSAIFPEGVFVGVIEDTYKQKNEESNSLKVRLFTDFSTLNDVLIIRNPFREEQLQIMKGIGGK